MRLGIAVQCDRLHVVLYGGTRLGHEGHMMDDKVRT